MLQIASKNGDNGSAQFDSSWIHRRDARIIRSFNVRQPNKNGAEDYAMLLGQKREEKKLGTIHLHEHEHEHTRMLTKYETQHKFLAAHAFKGRQFDLIKWKLLIIIVSSLRQKVFPSFVPVQSWTSNEL